MDLQENSRKILDKTNFETMNLIKKEILNGKN